MAAPRRLRASNRARRTSNAVGALVGLVLALLPAIAAAQEAESTTDRDRVMWLTALVAVGTLTLAAIGYAYRRMRGMDHPTPDELEMMGGHHGGHDQSAAEHGAHEAVPPHAEAEHGAAAH